MATNTLNTRIQLKYDSYTNWVAVQETFKPLKGELCVVNPGTALNNASTVPCLMKVGDGEHFFKDLPWVSATAADVYAWAKQAALFMETTAATTADGKYTGNAITNVTWDSTLNDGKGGLKAEKGVQFATKAELDAAVEAFGGDIDALTDNDTRYSFEIPTEGDYKGALAVTAVKYINGVAEDAGTTTYYDFVTPDELAELVPQSDYSVNDENDPAYIKNRPFYEAVEKVELLSNVTSDVYYNGGEIPKLVSTFNGGQSYDIVLNGQLYEGVICYSDAYDTYLSITLPNEGYFDIYCYEGGDWRPSCYFPDQPEDQNPVWTLSISTVQNVIHRIEQKYLPFYEIEGVYGTWYSGAVETVATPNETNPKTVVYTCELIGAIPSSGPVWPENGKIYRITVDGTIYDVPYTQVYSSVGYFGAERLVDQETGNLIDNPLYPFSIWRSYSGTDLTCTFLSPITSLAVQYAEKPAVVVQIEEKFIPNSIARASAVNAADAALSSRLEAVEAQLGGGGEGTIADLIEQTKNEILEQHDEDITAVRTDFANQDAVVLSEAQKYADAIKAELEEALSWGEF